MGAIICLPEKRVWFVFCELWLLNIRPIGDISSPLLAEFTFGYFWVRNILMTYRVRETAPVFCLLASSAL